MELPHFSDGQVGEFLRDATALPSFFSLVAGLVVLAAILLPLEAIFPASKQPLLRLKGSRLDLLYWFFNPIFTRSFTNLVLLVILFTLLALRGEEFARDFVHGHRPISRQPLWLQIIELLLIVDFIDYWTHRLFHSNRLWRFHAIHHSPEEMNWVSSSRMHPVNDMVTRVFQVVPVVLLGFSVHAVLVVVPYLVFYVIFLHSNLSWDFGALRYVFVSPAYHRWHHASDEDGLDKNFSGIFSIWDILFGTCYFPAHLPKRCAPSQAIRSFGGRPSGNALWTTALSVQKDGARGEARRCCNCVPRNRSTWPGYFMSHSVCAHAPI